VKSFQCQTLLAGDVLILPPTSKLCYYELDQFNHSLVILHVTNLSMLPSKGGNGNGITSKSDQSDHEK